MKSSLFFTLTLVLSLVIPVPGLYTQAPCAEETEMMPIPAGQHQPFMAGKDTLIRIASFYMDKYPVTNRQFREFVKHNNKWAKEKIKPLFADDTYLQHWVSGMSFQQEESPVVNVSWYAAQAYCECQGKRLPTIYEWEYAAGFDLINQQTGEKIDPDDVVLKWYSSPNPEVLPVVATTYKNELGIYDMHGLIWEWVLDFNSVMLPNDARNKKELEKFYCAAGALGAADPSDYASFLRFGLRSSLKANYSIKNLGFRCVKDK